MLRLKFDIIKTVGFLARDTTGQLYGFDKRPVVTELGKGKYYWTPKKGGYMIFIRERDNSLSFIKNSDEVWIVDVIEDNNDRSIIELINGDEVYKIERNYGVISIKKEEYISVVMATDEPVFTSHQSIEKPKTNIRKLIEKIMDKLKL